jgi:hypothetical protein
MVTVLMLAWLLTATGQDSGSWPLTAPVRSSSTQITALLLGGVRDSPTLKRLIEKLETTDGIVYVESGTCRRGADKLDACLANDVVAAGAHRYLRVLVNLGKNRVDLTGSIGHELQHAVEVLSDRSVTSTASMLASYQGDGRNGARSYETTAAVDTGLTVAREIAASRRRATIRQ